MKTYLFEVFNLEKKRIKVTLDFETQRDFYKYLKKNRYILIKYRIIKRKYRISKREIIEFTQNFKILLESGLTITKALDILIDNNSKLSGALRNIQLKILEGNNLYTAFSTYSNIFRESYLNIILAGEESGKLLENLERIYNNLLFEENIRKKIKEATFYPTIILIFTLLLITFILTFVFPNFIEFFNDTEVELPLLTKSLIYLSSNFYTLIFFLIFLIVISYTVLKRLGKESIERLKLFLPIYGNILKRRLIIELCKNISILSESEIEIVNIFEILKRGSNYQFQKRGLADVQLKIKMGNSIAEAFSKGDFFTSTQLYLIDVGEKSGNIERAFNSIAYTMEKELEYYLFKLTSLLEPILLVILGVIVGIVVLGIYLPIFNISQIL